MKELLNPTNLITDYGKGEITLKYEIGHIIKAIEESKAAVSEQEQTLRTALLDAMQINNIDSAKVEGYTISQVKPKSTWVFDKDKFIEEVETDVSTAFISFETIEEFDLERFKAENPELFKKYVTTKEEVKVDEKKLYKMLPSLYNKYATEIKSDKSATLRIVKTKGE